MNINDIANIAGLSITDGEIETVKKSFFRDGRLIQSPSKMRKRHIAYLEIFKLFDAGRSYSEREVNGIIASVYEDFCEVRRHFIDFGWMKRENGVYWIDI